MSSTGRGLKDIVRRQFDTPYPTVAKESNPQQVYDHMKSNNLGRHNPLHDDFGHCDNT